MRNQNLRENIFSIIKSPTIVHIFSMNSRFFQNIWIHILFHQTKKRTSFNNYFTPFFYPKQSPQNHNVVESGKNNIFFLDPNLKLPR